MSDNSEYPWGTQTTAGGLVYPSGYPLPQILLSGFKSDENKEKKAVSLDIKKLQDDGSFSGLLSVYDVVDEYNDIVERGAFTKTLQESGGTVPLLWQHDTTQPIGTLELEDVEGALEAKGSILLDVPQGQIAHSIVKAFKKKGLSFGLSIGYRAVKKKVEGNIRRLKEIKLYEGSLVTFPANRFAVVTAVKTKGVESKDFMSELEAIQTRSKHYQLIYALETALDAILYSDDSADERLEATREVLAQFSKAYLEFLPTLLDLRGVKGTDQKREPVTGGRYAAIREQFERLEALMNGTAEKAAAASAADNGNEPEHLHSWLTGFSQGWATK